MLLLFSPDDLVGSPEQSRSKTQDEEAALDTSPSLPLSPHPPPPSCLNPPPPVSQSSSLLLTSVYNTTTATTAANAHLSWFPLLCITHQCPSLSYPNSPPRNPFFFVPPAAPPPLLSLSYASMAALCSASSDGLRYWLNSEDD